MPETQALINLGCEPGSEKCSGCGFQACAEGSCETYCSLYYEPNPDGKRTPSCLASESAARELREEIIRLEQYLADSDGDCRKLVDKVCEQEERAEKAEADIDWATHILSRLVEKFDAHKRENEGMCNVLCGVTLQARRFVNKQDTKSTLAPAPTVSKTETVDPAPAPELTEDLTLQDKAVLKFTDQRMSLSELHAICGQGTGVWSAIRRCKENGLLEEADPFLLCILTPAGREAARLFADRQTTTPATEAERVNEEGK